MTNKLIEAMARAIEPYAFRQHELMVAHCLNSGDTPDVARRYADMTYGQNIEDARSDAQAVLKAISDTGYAIVPCEPSEAMWDAAMREGYDQDPATYYRAMINATTTEEI